MRVRTYIQQHEQRPHKGHNRPHVLAGTPVAGIYHAGKWFAYAYLSHDFAQVVCDRLAKDVDDVMIAFNFKGDGPIAVSDRTGDRK